MTPQRLSLKVYLADGAAVDPAHLVPMFHGWIRQPPVDGVLVDVADYKHVGRGPAVVLVGHEADYAVDLSEERPGLVYVRKRPLPADLATDLRLGMRRLLQAACAFEERPQPHPPVRFSAEEWRLQAIDRLRFPNTPEAAADLKRWVEPALATLFAGVRLEIADAEGDRRAPLTLRVRARGAPDLRGLLQRLG
jgi:hypothetical protein